MTVRPSPFCTLNFVELLLKNLWWNTHKFLENVSHFVAAQVIQQNRQYCRFTYLYLSHQKAQVKAMGTTLDHCNTKVWCTMSVINFYVGETLLFLFTNDSSQENYRNSFTMEQLRTCNEYWCELTIKGKRRCNFCVSGRKKWWFVVHPFFSIPDSYEKPSRQMVVAFKWIKVRWIMIYTVHWKDFSRNGNNCSHNDDDKLTTLLWPPTPFAPSSGF